MHDEPCLIRLLASLSVCEETRVHEGPSGIIHRFCVDVRTTDQIPAGGERVLWLDSRLYVLVSVPVRVIWPPGGAVRRLNDLEWCHLLKFEAETNLLVWSQKEVSCQTSEAADYATLRYASITHHSPPPNCQRESCIVGNVGFKEEDGIKKRWHESEMINLHYYSTDYSIKK